MSAAYDRIGMNRKLHWMLAKIPRGMGTKADLAYKVSGGRTERSSELTDEEHRLLVRMVEERTPGQTRRRRVAQRRQEADPSALPTGDQKDVIVQMYERLGMDDEAFFVWCQAAHGYPRPTTRGQARSVIEALKSKLVRDLDMMRRVTELRDVGRLAGRELALANDFLRTVGNGGRAVAKAKSGGVIWLADILKRENM